VHGTSTPKVDDLVKALGVDAGIAKSEVSRICAELDGEVAAFRSRPLVTAASRMWSWTPPRSTLEWTAGWCRGRW
jgi:transposase-like protein